MYTDIGRRYDGVETRLNALELGVRLLARWEHIFARLTLLEEGKTHCSVHDDAAPAPAEPKSAPASSGQPTLSVTPDASPTQQRLEQELIRKGFSEFKFVRVPGDYYDQSLEYRMQCVGAASIHHLCKSIIMENTRAHPSVDGWSNPLNSKYYVVIVQYSSRLHTGKLGSFIHKLSDGKVGTQFYNMRLAPGDISDQMSGFEHNAVSPVGMATPDLPMIISHKILQLQPEFFFLGGGEVDLKLGTWASEFVKAYKPFVVDCTYD